MEIKLDMQILSYYVTSWHRFFAWNLLVHSTRQEEAASVKQFSITHLLHIKTNCLYNDMQCVVVLSYQRF